MSAAVLKILLMLPLLLISSSGDELRSIARFKNASLTAVVHWQRNVTFEISAAEQPLATLVSRSRVECARSCVLNSDCQASNFHKKDKTCILMSGFTGGVLKEAAGWDYFPNKKVNIRKGRLGMADGPTERRGRAEANVAGRWGTICDLSFTFNGWPTTFCGDMGYSRVQTALWAVDTAEGKGTGHISWEDLKCSGPSNLIMRCWENAGSCGHEKDVVVECSGGL